MKITTCKFYINYLHKYLLEIINYFPNEDNEMLNLKNYSPLNKQI